MPGSLHSDNYASLVNHWLHERAPDISLDDSGVASLMRDEQTFFIIEVPSGGNVCHFYAPAIALSESDPESDLYAAMALNCYGRPLGGCWLAWDEEIQMLVLCYNLNLQATDGIHFWNALDNFLLALDAARAHLIGAKTDTRSESVNTEVLLGHV